MQREVPTCVAWSNANELWLPVSKYRPSPRELYALTMTCPFAQHPPSSDMEGLRSCTGWLLSGNVTVANCSSLYLSSAGSSDWREASPAIVLMAAEGLRQGHAGGSRMGVRTVGDI